MCVLSEHNTCNAGGQIERMGERGRVLQTGNAPVQRQQCYCLQWIDWQAKCEMQTNAKTNHSSLSRLKLVPVMQHGHLSATQSLSCSLTVVVHWFHRRWTFFAPHACCCWRLVSTESAAYFCNTSFSSSSSLLLGHCLTGPFVMAPNAPSLFVSCLLSFTLMWVCLLGLSRCRAITLSVTTLTCSPSLFFSVFSTVSLPVC